MKKIKYISILMLAVIVAMQCIIAAPVLAADDIASHRPESVLLSAGDKNLTFTWKNPSASDIEKISIYDITDEDEVLVTDAINKTPSKYILHQITGLTNNVYKQYKIVFEYTSFEDFTFYMSGMPSTTTEQRLSEVTLVRNGANTKMLPASVTIDTAEKHGGSSSVKITSAYVTDSNYSNYSGTDWGYAALFYKLASLESGNRYRVSYWAKGKNANGGAIAHMYWGKFENGSYANCPATDEWAQYTYTYDYTVSYATSQRNTFCFICDKITCAGFWIDDLEVYKLDDDGNPIGDNLAVNGGFEFADDNMVEINDARSEDGINSSVLSWDIEEDAKYVGTNIYREIDGEYEYIGRLAKGINTFKPENLVGGNTYNFKVAAVNEYGTEGEAVTVTANPVIPPYEVGGFVLKKDNTETAGLSGEGEYKVEISLKNNTMEEGLNAEMIVVLCGADGVLRKVFSAKDCFAVSGRSEMLEVPFTVTGEVQTAEVFLFDSRLTMNIIGGHNSHKIYNKINGGN